MICAKCGTRCVAAEGLNELSLNLLQEGYKPNYVIIATQMYRVHFAHPKLKHVIIFANQQKKTDATRAKRLLRKEEHLKAAGWKVTVAKGLPCSVKASVV
jgi:hypothetical protein